MTSEVAVEFRNMGELFKSNEEAQRRAVERAADVLFSDVLNSGGNTKDERVNCLWLGKLGEQR